MPLVKMSSSRPGDQVDSDNNNLGESNMITEKVFNVFKPLKIVKQLGLELGTGIYKPESKVQSPKPEVLSPKSDSQI